MTKAELLGKGAIREYVRARVKALTNSEKSAMAAAACARIAALGEFAGAKTVLAYRAMKSECSPETLVHFARREGKRIAFPLCVEGNRLALYAAASEGAFCVGKYGILEPVPELCEAVAPEEVDFAIIPGVAFDYSCNRVGHGAGYYDRLLETMHCPAAGLAFDCQMFTAVPVQEHDRRMDFVAASGGLFVKNPR